MNKGHLKQYLVGLTVSMLFAIAGMVYGWTAPVMVRLQSNTSDLPLTKEESGYVAAAVEFGDIFTPIPAGIIADRFGRKPVIIFLIPLYVCSWLFVIFTRSFRFLILARILFGMAMGIVFTICPIYLAEITEPEIRGKITAICTVFWFFGILMAYSIGPYVMYDTLSYISISLPLALAFVIAIIPESPYNLLSRGKYEKARKSLMKLRNRTEDSIDKELHVLKAAINDKVEMGVSTLFTNKGSRLALLLVILIGWVALFGGVTIVYTYATEIFISLEGIPLNADQCTIVLGTIYCILSIVATFIVDHYGRRKLLMISTGGASVCHFISGLYFYLQNNTAINVTSHGYILLLSVIGYCVVNSIGLIPITAIYQGEIFPDGIKGIASGLCILEQCVLSMLALKLFQIADVYLGKEVSFWFFSLVNAGGCILIYLYLVETRGKTLAEIQNDLMRTKKHKNIVLEEETIPIKTNS